MRLLLSLAATLAVLLLAGAIQAAPCQGDDTTCQLDWTDGDGVLVIPDTGTDGQPLDPATSVTCMLIFGTQGSLGTAQITGAPGDRKTFTVPDDATDSVRAVCNIGGTAGEVTAATATFPSPFSTAPPAAPTLDD